MPIDGFVSRKPDHVVDHRVHLYGGPSRSGAVARIQQALTVFRKSPPPIAACACGRLLTVRPRRRRDADREAAIKGVAAYLADDDAEVHNLTEAAVREDALTAALRLTALAADAVVELAALRKLRPEQVLQSLTEGSPDTTNHRPEQPQLAVQVVYPAPMDDHGWVMTEAKGWIEVTVRSTEVRRQSPSTIRSGWLRKCGTP